MKLYYQTSVDNIHLNVDSRSKKDKLLQNYNDVLIENTILEFQGFSDLEFHVDLPTLKYYESMHKK